jgi:acyl carrier protein
MNPSAAFSDSTRCAEFFALAARIFGVDAATLTPATAYGAIPGWDSVNHLRLVMETEQAFGVRYPLERIPSLLTLADFLTDGHAV